MSGSGRRRRVVAGALAGVLVLGVGGYAAADAYDVVPGVLTVAPPLPTPAPFPTAPGATPAPELVTDVVDTSAGDAADAAPDAAQVRAWAEAVVTHPWMGTSVGVVVADAATGDVLVDLSGDAPREPASTAKILTAVAALRSLGPDRTLTTSVVRTAPDEVVLVGGGDVMLTAGPSQTEGTNGRASLADLADEAVRSLRLAGVTQVRLGVDDSLFSGPAIPPGWEATDISNGFAAPVTALAVNLAKTRDEPYPPRHADPSLHAATTFAGLLAERGVAVVGEPVRRTVAEGAGEVLGTVESAPVRDVVRYALQTSDNDVAEVLGRLTAIERGLPGSAEGSTRAILMEVQQLGLDTASATLADASGLAEGSSVPTSLVVDVLQEAAADPVLRAVLVDLPLGGWQGTLGERFTELPGRGLVRAKTGSLVGVTALAGTVVTAEGRQLTFAVLADRTPPGGQLGPRRVIDAFVQQLAGCGCSLPS